MLNKSIIIIFIIGLFFSFTNFIYVSAVPSVIFIPFVLFFLFSINKTLKITYYLYLYFFVSIFSTVIYHSKSFFNFNFYRFDGNFIISYLPLLILPYFSRLINLEKIVTHFFIFVIAINIILFFLEFNVNQGIFHSLFVAHNAAGGYFSIIFCFFFIKFINKKNYFNLVLLICSTFIFIVTYSRGSMIGAFLAIIIVFLINKNKIQTVCFVLVIIITFQIFLVTYHYQAYETIKRGSLNNYILNTLNIDNNRDANIYIRIIYDWPRAINCFLESPIFGTGFGSINDMPFKFKEITPFFSYNSQEIKTFSSSHAHHSFFHILGEQGLFGLFIFLLFWNSIFNYLKKQEKSIMRNFLILTFWTISFSSLTEHRITTPATMIPFCIILGLYIANQNYLKNQPLKNPIENH